MSMEVVSSRNVFWLLGFTVIGVDVFVAWCWEPAFLVTHALNAQHAYRTDRMLVIMMITIMLISLLHQSPTLIWSTAMRRNIVSAPRYFDGCHPMPLL
jgi:accessory gene regulator protein AgrB